MQSRMDTQQIRLDSLEDLLDVMAVGNRLCRALDARRAALDATTSSRVHGGDSAIRPPPPLLRTFP
ncbi:hypothetical protein Bca52824_095778 [Brassica carinata]|uniref:Uncharacterized protein n=1 Tax=Brassica carinata TaxID=52824 RepID=A0A8X7TJF3_BRACI|nr:hypothetical protein Bca52824_095778 [Brassica carinata]